MKTTTPPLRYEDAAEEATVTGWICKKCRRWYGYGADGEHMARYCCCTERPCTTAECTGRCAKSWSHCPDCRRRHEDERWAKLKRVEWDGTTPVAIYHDDRFFFGVEDLLDHMAVHDLTPETIRLVLCEPNNGRHFDMTEYLEDDLPEGGDTLDDTEINKAVNDWIDAHAPFSWEASCKAISVESVRAFWETEVAP